MNARTKRLLDHFGYIPNPVERLLIWPATFFFLTYMTTFVLFRQAGVLPLVFFTAVCALFFAPLPRVLINPWAATLFGFSTLILIFSLERQMPTAWTRYYDPSAALRQWVWVPQLAIFSVFSFKLFAHLRQPLIRNSGLIAMSIFAISRVCRYFSPYDLEAGAIWLLYGLNNDEMLIYIFAILFIYFKIKNKTSQIVLLILLTALASSAQTVAVGLVLIAIRVARQPMTVVRLYIVFFFIFLLAAPHFAIQISHFDANSGVRALFWKDASRAIVQSHGLGVGFGTEYITNDFRSLGFGRWGLRNWKGEGQLFIGTHSALYDVAMRVGVIGGFFLLMWLLSFVKFSPRKPLREDYVYCSIYALFITSVLVNPGLASINYLLGNALCVGLMIYLTRTREASVDRPRVNLALGEERNVPLAST